MLFPESPREVYAENPLEEVICQLRFPPILEISNADPAEFQNLVRDQYPLYTRDAGPALPGLPPELGRLIRSELFEDASRVLHRFPTPNGSRVISLARDFVALSDREYSTWEHFLQGITLARSALEDTYRPAFYSRVGLRYRDVIDRERLGLVDVPWESLLNEALIGSFLAVGDFAGNVRRIETVALLAVDEIHGGFLTLRHGLVHQDGQDQKYVIDSDFYSESREATSDVTGVLGQFNRLAGRLFRWAIKPTLREALRPSALN